jgi:PST family polysaccharide transporter
MTADSTSGASELQAAAIHGVRWSTIARPVTEVLLLGSMVLLAHLIPPADFGRYAVALVLQEVAQGVPTEGISNALVQRKVLRHEHLESGAALGLIIGLVLAGVMLVLASLVVEPIFGGRTAMFVRLMTPLCLLSGASTVPTAMLSRRMAFRRLSVMEVVSALVRVTTCIVLALMGLGGEALVLGTLAGAVATLLIVWTGAWPPLPRLHWTAAKEVMRHGMPLSLASLSWVGFSNVDYAIIGARLGPVQAGFYFRAYTVAIEYQKKVSMVMGQVGFPVLARTRTAEELARMHRQMVRLLTILLFPLLTLLAIVAPTLVPFLFGHNWTRAVVPIQVLALGGASTLVIEAAGTILMVNGRTRVLLGFGTGHFIVYGLSVLAVVHYGIVAVAIDAAVVHTLFLLMAYAVMLSGTSENPLRRLWGDVAPATVSCVGLTACALPVALLLRAAHTPTPLELPAAGVAGGVGYLLTLRLAFPAVWRVESAILERILPGFRRPRRIDHAQPGKGTAARVPSQMFPDQIVTPSSK